MATIRDIATDIAITMGFRHDDADRWLYPISYNVQLAIDKLKDAALTKSANVGGDIREAASMISTFVVPVVYEQTLDATEWSHHYFDLPKGVYSLPFGKEISLVRYHRNSLPDNCPPSIARAAFTLCGLAELSAIYDSTYQRPSPAQPYVCREGNYRVHIFGMDPSITTLIVAIYAAPNLSEIDPDDDLDITPEKLFTVKRMVLSLESWALQIPQERLRSDGRDFEPGETVRVSPIMSINDPSQQDA